MDAITYFSKAPHEGMPTVRISDHDEHHLKLDLGSGLYVLLNSVQVDKMRQQFHGWLHERALGEDSQNWVEEKPGQAPVYPTRGFNGAAPVW